MKYKELRDELKLATKVALELAEVIAVLEGITSTVIALTPRTYEWLEVHDKKGVYASQVPVSE